MPRPANSRCSRLSKITNKFNYGRHIVSCNSRYSCPFTAHNMDKQLYTPDVHNCTDLKSRHSRLMYQYVIFSKWFISFREGCRFPGGFADPFSSGSGLNVSATPALQLPIWHPIVGPLIVSRSARSLCDWHIASCSLAPKLDAVVKESDLLPEPVIK